MWFSYVSTAIRCDSVWDQTLPFSWSPKWYNNLYCNKMCKSYCANNCHINVLCKWNTCNIRWRGIDIKEQNTTVHSYFTSQISGTEESHKHKHTSLERRCSSLTYTLMSSGWCYAFKCYILSDVNSCRIQHICNNSRAKQQLNYNLHK